jgi:hypothetical protein
MGDKGIMKIIKSLFLPLLVAAALVAFWVYIAACFLFPLVGPITGWYLWGR